ncbi:hypothetical protein DL93DRAFT_2230142 [Clavulina sp. PMI_390]|nr:hypothetical protein DL93DRAFT_2230142 [Clavulina sp. PMI_390]
MASHSEKKNKFFVPALVAGIIIFGAANSLFAKYQDNLCVDNCNDDDPKRLHHFEQPFWQALQMCVAELLCFIPIAIDRLIKYRCGDTGAIRLPISDDDDVVSNLNGEGKTTPGRIPLEGWNIFLMWIPAFLDLTGMVLMLFGLMYTPVSLYQMTRGALVASVGVFSVLFLKRKLWLYQTLSLVVVMVGVFLVGLSGALRVDRPHVEGDSLLSAHEVTTKGVESLDEITILIGVMLTLSAQVFSAAQFIVEEKIMMVYSLNALEVVAWEGVFETLTLVLTLPFILTHPAASPFFDLGAGWRELTSSPSMIWSAVGLIISFSFFTSSGLAVTRETSAMVRSTADICRTVAIWIMSLMLGWEYLAWPWTLMQLAGFVLVVYGTLVFNGVIRPPPYFRRPAPLSDDIEQFSSQ